MAEVSHGPADTRGIGFYERVAGWTVRGRRLRPMPRRGLVRSVASAVLIVSLLLLYHTPSLHRGYGYLYEFKEHASQLAAAIRPKDDQTGKVESYIEATSSAVLTSGSGPTNVLTLSEGLPSTTASHTALVGSSSPEKIVVIGKLQHEETGWVAQHLPEWRNAIYTVDNTSHALHTRVNKGREANAYLTYIIQNYNRLAATVAFIHPHRDGYPAGWHTDNANYDNVLSLQRLNIPFVQRNGYANLRCIPIPGCPDEVQPFRDPPKPLDLDEVAPAGPSLDDVMRDVWPLFFGGNTTIPEAIGTPCCAQFAVSRDQIRKRSLAEYEVYHKWLMATEVSDAVSGRVFEYLWHIIFGQGAVYCPELTQCYNDVYGS